MVEYILSSRLQDISFMLMLALCEARDRLHRQPRLHDARERYEYTRICAYTSQPEHAPLKMRHRDRRQQTEAYMRAYTKTRVFPHLHIVRIPDEGQETHHHVRFDDRAGDDTLSTRGLRLQLEDSYPVMSPMPTHHLDERPP